MSDTPASTAHSETAGQTETSDDNLIPPGAEPFRLGEGASYSAQVLRLEAFLAERFPDEVGRSNYQRQENAVETAIRLLTGLHAHTPPTQVERCTAEFCNKPRNHTDIHGWVHFG